MPLGDQNNFNVINFIIDLMGETKGKIRFGYISISGFSKVSDPYLGFGRFGSEVFSRVGSGSVNLYMNSKLCKNSSENDNITIFVC